MHVNNVVQHNKLILFLYMYLFFIFVSYIPGCSLFLTVYKTGVGAFFYWTASCAVPLPYCRGRVLLPIPANLRWVKVTSTFLFTSSLWFWQIMEATICCTTASNNDQRGKLTYHGVCQVPIKVCFTLHGKNSNVFRGIFTIKSGTPPM